MKATGRMGHRAVFLEVALLAALIFGGAVWRESSWATDAAAVCVECLQFRIGPPRVVRGPSLTIADNHFSEIELPTGRFRGFDAHSETRAIDGASPWDMGGEAQVVLRPGKAGTYDSCGEWLNHAEIIGPITVGLIHDETACQYENHGQTHKSMSIATSTDFGLHWNLLGQVISGSDPSTPGHESGEGDCTAVNGQDSYLYAYCVRAADRALIVARAPIQDLGPGRWMKFYQGQWDQPGLGGLATRVGNGSGASVARLGLGQGLLVFTGWVPGGAGLFFSANYTSLTALREPLMPMDSPAGRSATSVDRILYPVILDAKNGSNQLSLSWNLVYAYWPANEARDQKYLLFREINVSQAASPVFPQVGVAIARWYDPQRHDRLSTIAPVADNNTAHQLERVTGYSMSMAPKDPSVLLEECLSTRGDRSDHMLAEKGFCASHGYQLLRTAGWIYRDGHSHTTALYRCYSAAQQSHFVSQEPDCEGLGSAERLLGYTLQ